MSDFLPEENEPQEDGDMDESEGVNSGQVLDICTHIINRCWGEIFGENAKPQDLDACRKLMELAGDAHRTAIEVVVGGNKVRQITSDGEDEELYNDEEDEDLPG